ncbi:hypothetical protein QR680_008714 [Steinernema hermaphroditum]|uniref:Uncharacterized protein n=1 Tax=Steinernema hermaphroditum TaxID=289476 RepID=A0AA39M8E3_9BILA|nr:hypothetical protein QR680_008714 [Steinernema hermaphroditum]
MPLCQQPFLCPPHPFSICGLFQQAPLVIEIWDEFKLSSSEEDDEKDGWSAGDSTEKYANEYLLLKRNMIEELVNRQETSVHRFQHHSDV